jgi:threonine/homoserine/homoserine lactone efflux protein
VIESILLVAGLTFLVMLSPGPDLVLVTRNTLVGGRAAGTRTYVGILLGNAVHMTYCALGIGWVISKSIVAFSVLKYAGALYLIYLGIQSLRASGHSIDAEPTDPERSAEAAALDPGQRESAPLAATRAARPARRSERWLAQGFLNNILNPKGTLFYLGVFTMVITPETSWATTGALVATMTAVSTAFWIVFVATLDRPIVRQTLERSRRAVDRVFGALLIALGLRVATLDR